MRVAGYGLRGLWNDECRFTNVELKNSIYLKYRLARDRVAKVQVMES